MSEDAYEIYPHAPGHQDTDTSKEAAESIKPCVVSLRLACLSALGINPMTADEVASSLRKSILSIRPRLTELRRLGQIEDTGWRRPNESGKRAIVWRVRKTADFTTPAI